MNITLSEIRSFHALVKFGSFTLAAKHLGVSQPAITAQVRRLEARTKQMLLERYHKEVKPTELGLQLYSLSCEYIYLDAAVDELFSIEAQVEEFQLRVATASPIIFMPLMAAFRKHYPHARLQVISGTTDDCRMAVMNREADIGLFPMYDAPQSIESMAFHSHHLVAVLNPNHPLAGADSVDISELSQESIIAHKPTAYTQMYANRLLADRGFTPNIEMEMGMSEHVCNAVTLGLGIGFSLSDDIRTDNSRYSLVPIEGETDVIEHVSWLRLHSKKRGIAEFVKLAKAHSTLWSESTESS